MISAIPEANTGIDTAITAPMVAKRAILAPMMAPPFFALPIPICCPRNIVAPIARLVTRLPSVIMIWDPVTTAETSSLVANFPTTNRSTAPYIACKNNANITGMANRISGPIIFPSVKLTWSFITDFFPSSYVFYGLQR